MILEDGDHILIAKYEDAIRHAIQHLAAAEDDLATCKSVVEMLARGLWEPGAVQRKNLKNLNSGAQALSQIEFTQIAKKQRS